ncbi:hypothetical protein Nepgr_025507 [Nepenthes gracilis]|uniref:Uncharacterized protein n=1 Tax=Nepenthes gracilis TaxID=150966 RepID=A0AAD3T6H7_NEPGR|nr:hypothetical protein Nepgr_025507 [Nepenthes gracilis]
MESCAACLKNSRDHELDFDRTKAGYFTGVELKVRLNVARGKELVLVRNKEVDIGEPGVNSFKMAANYYRR